MLALAFLNPMLLWALPLAAVPIIIHILNRRRFKKVPWAAMEFLLRAMKRNRKRLRLEQWLVLLLRVVAVMLLALLVARPQLGGGGLLGTRAHHVVVLDDSASMTQRSGSATLFERAQDRVKALADDLAQTRSGDLFSIVRASRGSAPDLWTTHVGPDLGRKTGATLKEWTVTDGAPDLGAVLGLAIERAGAVEDASRTHFYLVTDQRAGDFAGTNDKPRPSMQAALAAIDPETEHLTILAVGGQPQNLTVTGVRILDRMAIAGLPVEFAIDVHNHGLDGTPAAALVLEVDGQSRVPVEVPALGPDESVALPVTHTFGVPGFHRVEATLAPTERYPLDDRRTLALEVRERSRVLLVDGDPDDDNGETFFLQVALDPTEDGHFGIEPVVVTDVGLGEVDLAPYDFVWLCNVQAPSPELAQRLERFVADGGGLAIFCGPLVDVQRYDELFWRDGAGLLPLPLGDVDGDPDRPEGAVLVRRDHPIVEGIADVYELLLNNAVTVYRWLTIREVPDSGAAVIARIHDAEGPPLLVTRPFGAGGEVALFAITADDHWSNLPKTYLFLPAVRELHRFAARRRDSSEHNLLPDGTWRRELDPGVYRADVTVRALSEDGASRTFTAVERPPAAGAEATAGEKRPLLLTVPLTELGELGAFAVELDRHDGAPEQVLFARNPPVAESRLVGFDAAGFTRIYPKELHDRVTFVAAEGGLGAGPGEGEIWRWLAAILVAGLLLESLLAWRFGRR